MSRLTLQPAYALHNRRYRESSLIVDFLTRDHGRIALMVKGATSGKSARQNLIQPFIPVLIAWRGRGDLPTLTTIEAASHVPRVLGKTLYCGLYVNELILKLTERNETHTELFPVYAACLQDLLDAGLDNKLLEPALRRFEVRLLEELGLGMNLLHDQQGVPIKAAEHYHYDFLGGPVLNAKTENSVSGETLMALARGEFNSTQQMREARHLMRRVITHYLGGRQLKSRELFRGTGTSRKD